LLLAVACLASAVEASWWVVRMLRVRVKRHSDPQWLQRFLCSRTVVAGSCPPGRFPGHTHGGKANCKIWIARPAATKKESHPTRCLLPWHTQTLTE